MKIIVCMDKCRGIGFKNDIPWLGKYKEDMKIFKEITMNKTVVMGKNTFYSLKKPLPNRNNIVLTKDTIENVVTKRNLKDCPNDSIVIGGTKAYLEAFDYADEIFVSRLKDKYECDTYMPFFEDKFKIKDFIKYDNFDFIIYERNEEHQETQYLNLLKQIITSGSPRLDRTGVGTLSIFGARLEFDISNSFPLLTTKKLFWKGIYEELLWFLKGSTNSKLLEEKGIRIWEGNSSRKYLDSLNLDYDVGELGPVYGFQWRHFGAEYQKNKTDYTNEGVDQIKNVIESIKNNPTSRRHIINAWNCKDLKKMAIPPCHVMCQFYVDNDKLSCQLYQRSGDIGLGVPFNIASYSLLTYMIAYVCDLKPHKFIHIIGDAHIYNNHIEQVKIQLHREPLPFCKLKINGPKDIFELDSNNIELIDYKSHPAIKMDMAV